MDKLIRARKGLAQNSKKGFTLVELIVVIVIIAILIAALLPAVLGAIQSAEIAADQSDARAIMTAVSVWALDNLSDTDRNALTTGVPAGFNAAQIAIYVPGFGQRHLDAIGTMVWQNGLCTSIDYMDRSPNGVRISVVNGAETLTSWPHVDVE